MPESSATEVLLSQLHVSEDNVRQTTFEDEEFDALVLDVKKAGIEEPLIVEKDKDGYQVIVGSQRLAALQKVWKDKETSVPVIVREGLDALDRTILSARENLHRREMSSDDWRALIEKLKRMGLSQKAMSEALHVSQATISMMKSGKTWGEQKKSVTKSNLPPMPAERDFDPVECPSCGNFLIASLKGSVLELKSVKEKGKKKP